MLIEKLKDFLTENGKIVTISSFCGKLKFHSKKI